MTCKNRRPYNLYCVGGDVKPCSINQSATRGQISQQKCNKFNFRCGSASYPAGGAYAGASFEGGNCPVAPPSNAKQKIICSAKLPHTRRHILARRLPCHCMSVQFVYTSILLTFPVHVKLSYRIVSYYRPVPPI